MNSRRSEMALLAALLAGGAVLYAIRWALFPAAQLHNEMWRFLIGDVAFLFLQVAIVTLVIDGMLRRRERQLMKHKLNMVIGAFFSEIGTSLLGRVAVTDLALDDVRDDLLPKQDWTEANYAAAKAALAAHHAKIDISACDLYELKDMLEEEKRFVLGLLGNQALLEHEEFSELLWAVTHLAEELAVRESLDDLPAPDRIHITGDVKRVFTLLIHEWLEYVRHLQLQYPYLFSLAVRTNPLDPEAKAEVTALAGRGRLAEPVPDPHGIEQRPDLVDVRRGADVEELALGDRPAVAAVLRVEPEVDVGRVRLHAAHAPARVEERAAALPTQAGRRGLDEERR